MFLRISSRDGRCGYGRPIALVDRDSGELIGSFRNAAGAMRAKVMIEQVAAFDQSLSAAELSWSRRLAKADTGHAITTGSGCRDSTCLSRSLATHWVRAGNLKGIETWSISTALMT
jgi:hypothetical protein